MGYFEVKRGQKGPIRESYTGVGFNPIFAVESASDASMLGEQGGEASKRHKLLCVVSFEPEAIGTK